jgi:hypothetical protein
MQITATHRSVQAWSLVEIPEKTATNGKQGSEQGFTLPDAPALSPKPAEAGKTLQEGSKADFTHMSSRQLLAWINSEIASGRMSLDESSKYLGLTLNGMPVNPGADDSWRDECRNYLADLESGLDGAKFRGDPKEILCLQGMLDYLRQRQQGERIGGDVS